VHELLVASAGVTEPGKESGLALARGNFNIAGIVSAATSQGGSVEDYRGAKIVGNPQEKVGIAFVNATLVIAGDIVNVKAAIDRQSSPSTLPAALLAQINEWSNSQMPGLSPRCLLLRWCHAPARRSSGRRPRTGRVPNIQQAQAACASARSWRCGCKASPIPRRARSRWAMP
jgi:hypothetical protein